jgi:hypothetical protein
MERNYVYASADNWTEYPIFMIFRMSVKVRTIFPGTGDREQGIRKRLRQDRRLL